MGSYVFYAPVEVLLEEALTLAEARFGSLTYTKTQQTVGHTYIHTHIHTDRKTGKDRGDIHADRKADIQP